VFQIGMLLTRNKIDFCQSYQLRQVTNLTLRL
jgi:hypothetical protein